MLQYQVNDGGVVALLPDGRVEFLHAAIQPLLEEVRAGRVKAESLDYDNYIITDPLVELENFHLAAPAIVFVEVTNLCNLRCKHCYAWSGRKRPNEIETSLILLLLDQLDRAGVLQVFLTGGEIFAHPDAVRIIQYARTKRFSTQIFTNGLLITEDKLSVLPRGTSFFISFDTADPVRTIRGGMDFPTLHRCFSWMETYGHVFRTAISVHRNNIHDAEEIFDWCLRNRYPRPQWLETHPVGRALLHPEMMLRPEDVDEVFEVYKRCMARFSESSSEHPVESASFTQKDAIRSVDTIKFCQRLERATGTEKCGRSTAYINSAGDVFPCSNCMSNEMFKGGSLRERDFQSIWNEGFTDIRRITFADHRICAGCPINKEGIWCQFRCPPLATNVSKNPLGCGATDYLKEFMLRSARFWRERSERGTRLVLRPTTTSTSERSISHV